MYRFFPDNGFYQLSKDQLNKDQNNKDTTFYYLPRGMDLNDSERTGKPLLGRTQIPDQDVRASTRKDIFHEVLKIFMSLDEMLKYL